MARRGREHRQGRQPRLRIGHGRRDLQQQHLDPPLGGRPVEEVRVVFQRAHDAIGIVEQRQQQLIAGVAVVGVDGLEGDAREARLRGLAVEHLDERLDQRLPAGVALWLDRLDQLAEGQVLVGVGAERGLAHAAEQLAEGRVAREVDGERHLGEEAADDGLDLGPVAVGVVGAQDQPLLPGVAAERAPP